MYISRLIYRWLLILPDINMILSISLITLMEDLSL